MRLRILLVYLRPRFTTKINKMKLHIISPLVVRRLRDESTLKISLKEPICQILHANLSILSHQPFPKVMMCCCTERLLSQINLG